jgi:Flp pilus assembly CpaE family ATPase
VTLDPGAPTQESLRILSVSKPELILVDLADWDMLKPLIQAEGKARWIGFAAEWDVNQELSFAEAGISQILREPFGPKDLEAAAFDAFHVRETAAHKGLWAFLPSKAGAGCSTLVLNTARILQQLGRAEVLVMESDICSGCFSLQMNLSPARTITDALESAADVTTLEWRQFPVDFGGVHLLPADPAKPGRAPLWADYRHLLHFIGHRYKYAFVDLPDAIDDASAEAVRCAEYVFVVCTPEILSLKLAEIRCQNLLQRGVPRERIQLIVTRYKREDLPLADIEQNLGWPVYASIANDYRSVRDSILEATTVSGDSLFGKDCRSLAHKLSGIAAEPVAPKRFQLSRLIGK